MKTLQDRKLNPSNASPLLEIARVLVRVDHVASLIVNAAYSIVWPAALVTELSAQSQGYNSQTA